MVFAQRTQSTIKGGKNNVGKRTQDQNLEEAERIHQEAVILVTKVESDMMTAMTKGMPTYLFVVGDVELTEDELKEAEATEIEEEDDDSDDEVPDFIAALFGDGGVM